MTEEFVLDPAQSLPAVAAEPLELAEKLIEQSESSLRLAKELVSMTREELLNSDGQTPQKSDGQFERA